MQLNPESQAIVDKLNNDRSVKATSTTVGPFDQISKDILSILIANYDLLNNKSGEDRAKTFVAAYIKILKERSESEGGEEQEVNVYEQEEVSEQEAMAQNKWYIHNIECHSIRGIDSYGETFPFSFEGKSNLIYGPNGSGKSSLLGAVIWAFTGIAITDASDDKQETDIHQKTDGTKKGKKIRPNAWPVISTLPETGIEAITPDSYVVIELKSHDQSNSLYIKRTLSSLEAGLDKDKLQSCKGLEEYGIKPLDQQISLIAPTILSRNTLENANDIITILSMILGFDVLNDIGALASGIGRNRTDYARNIGRKVNSDWASLQEKLSRLADPLSEDSSIRPKILDITSKVEPTLKELSEKQVLVNEEIDAANKNVAEVLGINPEDKEAREGLADKLIEAIAHLEKDFPEVFPSYSEIEYKSEQHDNKSITTIDQEFTSFCEQAKKRIQRRINWWKREKEEGSKLSLKLRASSDYDVVKMECPVCDQSVKDLHIKDELEQLQTLDLELQRELKDFFKDLLEELEKIVPKETRVISQSLPIKRISSDWQTINSTFDKRLNGVIGRYDPEIQKIRDSLEVISVEPVTFFEDTGTDLLAASEAFSKACSDSLKTIEIFKWANKHFKNTKTQLHTFITSPEGTSLLSELSKSKDKASDIQPLNTIKTQLDEIIAQREALALLEAEHCLFESLKSPVDEIKKLSKYALEKTEEVFSQIKMISDKNWKLLYDESPTGLISSKLVIERGKTIEPFLSKHNYEVSGKYFANAGFQRAIALCFLCALIEKNDSGMSFVLFDDPILSLDEDHRERWADEMIAPMIENGYQIILATHQHQFKKNCAHDFEIGNIIEFNPRDTQRPLSWQLGGALDRVRDALNSDWRSAPNLLRKYCENILITFQAYCEDTFYNPQNLSSSISRYESLKKPNPLESPRKIIICKALAMNEIARVLDPGSHSLTEDDLTKPMVTKCLELIKSRIEGNFNSDLIRLKDLRKRKKSGKIIAAATSKATSFTFNETIKILKIGRAAARPDSWVVDETEQKTNAVIQKYACAHITGNTFDPVARCGQCILLSDSDDMPVDGDLVVGETSGQGKFLRRISFNDESAFLYSINPLKSIAPFQIGRNDLSVHRVVGVLYEPCRHCDAKSENGNEWHPCKNIDSSYFDNMKMISVEGDSMEPIARKGQNVLVKEWVVPQAGAIETGGLAVIETDDELIGNEIKRVYPNRDSWTLVSPNPLEIYAPHVVAAENIKKVWPLKGVIFESCFEDS